MDLVDHAPPRTPWRRGAVAATLLAGLLITVWFIAVPNGRSVKPLPAPDRSALQQAIALASPSTVKIKGSGCGVATAGSGVVVAAHLVLTAAHVLAGTTDSEIVDGSGGHVAIPVFVDPLSDLAVLWVAALNEEPLQINDEPANRGTVGAVLGYPHAGGLEASPAIVLDSYRAKGLDIYGRERIVRQILEVQTQIYPGSSGGPFVDSHGTLIGMVFGQSEDEPSIGYALVAPAIREVVAAALGTTAAGPVAVPTGACLPAGTTAS